MATTLFTIWLVLSLSLLAVEAGIVIRDLVLRKDEPF